MPTPPKSSSRLPEAAGRPPEERAFELALRALNRRERTSAQIRDWLEHRGFEPGVAIAVGERLEDAGGLDDARFARLYAEDRRELDGWGEERIRSALAQRGVPAELIDDALVCESSDAERALAQLVEHGKPVDDDAARGRALAFLVRRGYSSEVAYEAVRAAEKLAA
jgi:regulatory protein